MDARCQETREMAPELALGIVEGEERGRALQHLAECPDCRAEVEKFSEVADDLLLLAPHREAPVGFESRVLNELLPAPKPKRRRRLRLVLAPAAAALAAAGITLGIVWNDVQTGQNYNATLQKANGQEFEAYSLYAGDSFAGTAFSYKGAPNWLVITVDPAHRADMRSAELVMNDGREVSLNWFHLDPTGSSGGGIPVDPHNVSFLRLSPGSGGEPLVAHFTS
jgi:putative zinc finger protein